MKYTALWTACSLTALLFLSGMLSAQNLPVATQERSAQPTTSLDVLLVDLKQRREAKVISSDRPVDLNGQILRLQNELIDLRVERDQLAMQVERLVTRLQDVTVVGSSCKISECVPQQMVKSEKVLLQASHSLSLYLYGRDLFKMTECEEVKAYAENMMQFAIYDLELLGFDTTDLTNEEDLDDLLLQKKEMTEKARR